MITRRLVLVLLNRGASGSCIVSHRLAPFHSCAPPPPALFLSRFFILIKSTHKSAAGPLITVLTGVLTDVLAGVLADVLADALLSSFPPSARHPLRLPLSLSHLCCVLLGDWLGVLVCLGVPAYTGLLVCTLFQAFAHVQWETLYRRFMDSPNFKPWFTTQRTEAVERIR